MVNLASPEICVLKTDGVGCDKEMAYAFTDAGANPTIVHVNELRDGSECLANYGGLAIPGGFSYGDDISAGRVFANELLTFLGDDLKKFVDNEKPILGVCNGFQVLVKSGLLPLRSLGQQKATLAHNSTGPFDRRWIDLSIEDSRCMFIGSTDAGTDNTVPMEVAHGEGRFFGADDVIRHLNNNRQVVFRYAETASSIQPYNPNGSIDDIAGVCDESGLVLGMMPHPERSIQSMHPDRNRTADALAVARVIFSSIVMHAKEA